MQQYSVSCLYLLSLGATPVVSITAWAFQDVGQKSAFGSSTRYQKYRHSLLDNHTTLTACWCFRCHGNMYSVERPGRCKAMPKGYNFGYCLTGAYRVAYLHCYYAYSYEWMGSEGRGEYKDINAILRYSSSFLLTTPCHRDQRTGTKLTEGKKHRLCVNNLGGLSKRPSQCQQEWWPFIAKWAEAWAYQDGDMETGRVIHICTAIQTYTGLRSMVHSQVIWRKGRHNSS